MLGKIAVFFSLILTLSTNVETPSFPTVPTAYISNTFDIDRHVGIDFTVSYGSAVYSVLDGTIIAIKENDYSYGNYIIVEHTDGNASMYAHLSKISVEFGQKVNSGDVIGLSGGRPGDGFTTGPHLHFEIRTKGYLDNNKYNIEPMEYLFSFLDIPYKNAIVISSQGLSVRNKPNGTIIYSLFSKEQVRVINIRSGWAQLYSLRPEWVSLEWLHFPNSLDISSKIWYNDIYRIY